MKTILPLQKLYFDFCSHEVKVTCINGKYHCRVFTNGVLNQEAVCDSKDEIGETCRQLLRMEDKCGNLSKYANSARNRRGKKENARREAMK